MPREYDLLLREAKASDAELLIDFLSQIGLESDYTTLDEEGVMMSVQQMAEFLDLQASLENRISILAFLDENLAGLINITADRHARVCRKNHTGEIKVITVAMANNRIARTFIPSY